jgi:methionine-rich copper-binding protein CopC
MVRMGKRTRCKQLGRRFVQSLTLLLALVTEVSAHAILIETTRAANATVAGPVITLRLRINSRIDAARSRLMVVLPDDSSHKLKLEPQPSPDMLISRADDLKRGAYKLRWQVLAADGHITRGEIFFKVN